MARKTRKQKIQSQKRKAIQIEPASVLSTAIPVTKSPQTHVPTRTSAPRVEMSETEKALRIHTVKDITRTMIIISLLFAAQAALYIAQSNGYISQVLP